MVGQLLRGILAVLVLVGSAGLAHALSVVQRSFDELVALADVIVVGTVASKQAYWNDPVLQDRIYTLLTLSNLEVLKGDVPLDTYEIRLRGGQLGPYGEQFVGLPQLNQGARYVLFIKDNFKAVFPIVGVTKGLLEVRSNGDGKEYLATVDGRPLGSVGEIDEPSSGKALTSPDSTLTVDELRNEIASRLNE